jgi:hypothetical protein
MELHSVFRPLHRIQFRATLPTSFIRKANGPMEGSGPTTRHFRRIARTLKKRFSAADDS